MLILLNLVALATPLDPYFINNKKVDDLSRGKNSL